MDKAVQYRAQKGSTGIRIVTCGRNDVAALTMLVRKEMKASATALPWPCQPTFISDTAHCNKSDAMRAGSVNIRLVRAEWDSPGRGISWQYA